MTEVNDYIRFCDSCGKPMSEGYYLGGEYACSKECAINLYDNDVAAFEEDLSHADENCAECYWTDWEGIRFEADVPCPTLFCVLTGTLEFLHSFDVTDKYPVLHEFVLVHNVDYVFTELEDLECENLINMMEAVNYQKDYVSDLSKNWQELVFLDEELMKRVQVKCAENRFKFRMITDAERKSLNV